MTGHCFWRARTNCLQPVPWPTISDGRLTVNMQTQNTSQLTSVDERMAHQLHSIRLTPDCPHYEHCLSLVISAPAITETSALADADTHSVSTNAFAIACTQ